MLTVRRRITIVFILFTLSIWYLSLPPDSVVVLAVTFNAARFTASLARQFNSRDGWLARPASHPVQLPGDVGFLIKTGYGTRHRVAAQLEAFKLAGGGLGEEGRDYLVIGDWETNGTADAVGANVYDVVGLVMQTRLGDEYRDHARLVKYRSLREAVVAGDEERAAKLGKKYGWELDALKFIMGMEMSYQRMPHKKWYIILDDDILLVWPSLELLLGHLDPTKPQYVGNVVGDYKARFAHGGSAVIISGEAMRRLFSQPVIIADAYVRSLSETWGDRLVATTLQKVGVYIDERYGHYFNGETPEMTRILPDRVCSPIASFHGLRKPGEIVRAGEKLGMMKRPVLWGDLWDLFGTDPMEIPTQRVMGPGDHVGLGVGGIMTWDGIQEVRDCQRRCEESNWSWCFAWTYDMETLECHGSPWAVVGPGDSTAKMVSGINWFRVGAAMQYCSLADL